MGKITIIGLGAGNLNQLPLGIYRFVTQQSEIFVRTVDHPVVTELQQEGVTFEGYDWIYEEEETFERVYERIVADLTTRSQTKDITYAVPGHPVVAEQTTVMLRNLAAKGEVNVQILGGQSFLDDLFQSIGVDPVEGFLFLDGTQLSAQAFTLRQHVVISQLYSRFVAADVKLTLMERYADDHLVTIISDAGLPTETKDTVPLFELDHEEKFHNRTSLYVPPIKEQSGRYHLLDTLQEIVATLRAPGGCPWDRKQTHATLKQYLLEESHEFLAAVDEEDSEEMAKELGDVLLQIMLHAQIAEEEGTFTLQEVISNVSEKMVRRHPHVFGGETANTVEEVMKSWHEIKAEEVQDAKHESLLDVVPKGLANLMQAYDLQKKAAKVGFDWGDVAGAVGKFQEEWDEWLQAHHSYEQESTPEHKAHAIEEFGDVLFTLINVARLAKVYPEEAMHVANEKFRRRFGDMEQLAEANGEALDQLSFEKLEQYWQQAKRKETLN
ncbi:bifunctional methyltransferase/pyrophosphohydrolase YabN [Bacillus fonticola]|uniref:nucleoside triphosphate pyrophosphohydrolase n=1 Tax=Bacillus fonticola TaxID=2728853 RepID=UPI001476353C|nr:nucleoside triphosphate pyrophosphohydrolase [Bacillus fonticola]